MKSADLGKCSKNIHASQEYLKPTLAAVAVRLDGIVLAEESSSSPSVVFALVSPTT